QQLERRSVMQLRGRRRVGVAQAGVEERDIGFFHGVSAGVDCQALQNTPYCLKQDFTRQKEGASMPLTPHGDGIALSQLVEGNPVATIVIDAQHRVSHWNRACALLTGVPAEKMIGSRDQWRAFYSEPRPILADLIVDRAMDGVVDQFYRGKFQRSDSVEGAFEAEDFFPALGDGGRWLFFTAAAVRNAAGEIIGAIETLQDVSERRRAEFALRESEAQLAQIVDGS